MKLNWCEVDKCNLPSCCIGVLSFQLCVGLSSGLSTCAVKMPGQYLTSSFLKPTKGTLDISITTVKAFCLPPVQIDTSYKQAAHNCEQILNSFLICRLKYTAGRMWETVL